MVTHATKADWQQGQDALREETSRVTALLRSIEDPGVPAVGSWSLGEVAMHLSQVWLGLPSLARRDLSPVYEVLPEIKGAAGESMMKDIWELGDLMIRGVKNDPERDLGVLADRIDAEAERYFRECAGADPNEPRPWIVEGLTFPLSTTTYHLLNETLIHGYDIAHAAGRKWPIKSSHAAMALGRFIFRVFQAAPPRMFLNEAKAAGVRATYDVRLRGGDSFYFIFNDGGLTVEEPSSRTVDCHISADPVAMLLVAFARQSQWSAIAMGKLMAWGRKPWLGPQLRGLLRNP
ncbi:MAG: maleylpyruvate isomerase N-terminal domain-containing protein [Pseudonocardiaceae bacterium]